MPDVSFQWRWRWRKWLPGRHGQPCKVIARGKLNSCLVEFADGLRYVTSRHAVRLIEGGRPTTPDDLPRPILSIPQAAKELGLPYEMVLHCAKTGVLPTIIFPRQTRRRVRREDLDAFIESMVMANSMLISKED